MEEIEWVERYADEYADELVRQVWRGELFDIAIPVLSFDLGQYENLGGIEMPMWARKTWWTGDKQKVDELFKAYKAGQLSELEYNVRMCTAPQKWEHSVAYFEFEKSSVTVNQTLTDEDFRIELPEGTIMKDLETGTDFVYTRRTIAGIPRTVLILIGAGTIVVVGAGAFMLFRRPRHGRQRS